MRRRLEKGYSLVEIVVSLSIFGVFLFIIALLTKEMDGSDKRYPVNYLAHPQVSSVLSRLRRDVFDATAPYYVPAVDDYTQSKTTLILYALQQSGSAETVVWDFSTKGEARRLAFSVGNLTSEWVARGLPSFEVSSFPIPGSPDSVRVIARDPAGRLSIDQILQPRPHE